jgi:hypothetical protein
MSGEIKKNTLSVVCSRDSLDGAYPSAVLAINAVRLGHVHVVWREASDGYRYGMLDSNGSDEIDGWAMTRVSRAGIIRQNKPSQPFPWRVVP